MLDWIPTCRRFVGEPNQLKRKHYVSSKSFQKSCHVRPAVIERAGWADQTLKAFWSNCARTRSRKKELRQSRFWLLGLGAPESQVDELMSYPISRLYWLIGSSDNFLCSTLLSGPKMLVLVLDHSGTKLSMVQKPNLGMASQETDVSVTNLCQCHVFEPLAHSIKHARCQNFESCGWQNWEDIGKCIFSELKAAAAMGYGRSRGSPDRWGVHCGGRTWQIRSAQFRFRPFLEKRNYILYLVILQWFLLLKFGPFEFIWCGSRLRIHGKAKNGQPQSRAAAAEGTAVPNQDSQNMQLGKEWNRMQNYSDAYSMVQYCWFRVVV